MGKHKNTKGFTIIEVVLVLAIAGLIFLMVFVAIPSLQRSQRDNQRKQDLAAVAAALQQYRVNNRSINGLFNSDGDRMGCTGEQCIALAAQTGKMDSNFNSDGTATRPQSASGKLEKFFNQYLPDAQYDPDGTGYTIITQKCVASSGLEENSKYCNSSLGPTQGIEGGGIVGYGAMLRFSHVIMIFQGSYCGDSQYGNAGFKDTDSTNKFSVLYYLEGGGSYCLDNN